MTYREPFDWMDFLISMAGFVLVGLGVYCIYLYGVLS